jgi:anti-sigma regulatory factor (Ser/Thr protein kinase)
MKMDLHATPEEVMRAVETMQEFARRQGVPEKMLFGLALSLEECGSNVVNHGLRRDPAKTFSARFERLNDAFLIELRDSGPAFDPTAAASRPAPAEDDDLPGGWGIGLVRRYTDELQYRREGAENVLRLLKRLPLAAPAMKRDVT